MSNYLLDIKYKNDKIHEIASSKIKDLLEKDFMLSKTRKLTQYEFEYHELGGYEMVFFPHKKDYNEIKTLIKEILNPYIENGLEYCLFDIDRLAMITAKRVLEEF